MKTLISTLLAGLSILAMGPAAKASEEYGQIKAINFGTRLVSGNVSVFFGTPNDCVADGGWYTYRHEDSGVRKLWTEALLEAYINEKHVKIVGDGVCDKIGDEGVWAVQLQQPEPGGGSGSAPGNSFGGEDRR